MQWTGDAMGDTDHGVKPLQRQGKRPPRACRFQRRTALDYRRDSLGPDRPSARRKRRGEFCSNLRPFNRSLLVFHFPSASFSLSPRPRFCLSRKSAGVMGSPVTPGGQPQTQVEDPPSWTQPKVPWRVRRHIGVCLLRFDGTSVWGHRGGSSICYGFIFIPHSDLAVWYAGRCPAWV